MAPKLQSLGFTASALLGGYNAWREKYDIEPKSATETSPQDTVATSPPAGQTA